MSRDLTSNIDIPATVAEVFELRTSERWVAIKRDRLGDGSTLVRRVERPDGGVDLAVSRELPAGGPAFLEKFLPRDGRAVQNESWGPADLGGSRSGTWSVDLPGTPAKLGGTSTLRPSAGGSVQTITGTAKVPILLIGGKAEQFIVDMTTTLIATEAGLMVETLNG